MCTERRQGSTMGITHVRVATVLFILSLVQAGPCEFATTYSRTGNYSQPSFAQVWDCYNAVPYNATNAVTTIKSIRAALQSYSFLDVMKATGAPWNKRVDIMAALGQISSTAYSSDYAFHDALATLFSGLNDAHTIYVKPACFGVVALQPLAIVGAMENSKLVLRAAALTYRGTIDLTTGIVPTEFIGAQIVAIDGVKTITALSAYADGISIGDDVGSRFTAVLKRHEFVVRDGRYDTLPTRPHITYTFRTQSGLQRFNASWVFYAGAGMNVSNFAQSCLATTAPLLSCSTTATSQSDRSQHQRTLKNQDHPSQARILSSQDKKKVDEMYSALKFQSESTSQSADRLVHLRHRSEHCAAVSCGTIDTLDKSALRVDLAQALDGNEAIMDFGADVEVVSNHIAGYGLYVVYDSALNSIRVRLSTFNPPALTRCFSTSPCPTLQQKLDAIWCYDAELRNMINYSVVQPLHEFVTTGAQVLVYDLTSNGGGNVALGQTMLLALSQYLYGRPWLVSGTYDVRQSSLYSSILSFLASNPGVSDITPDLTAFSQFRGNAYHTVNRSDISWYSPGRNVLQGDGTTPVSVPVTLFDLYAFRSAAPWPEIAIDIGNLVLVTDGLCGSMCGQFLKTLQQHALARVIMLGGYPGATSDTASFVGGFVTRLDSIADGMHLLQKNGWNPAEDIVSHFPTTAILTFNFGARHTAFSSEQYLQFEPRQAHLQVFHWQDTSAPSTIDILRSATAAVMTQAIMLPDGTYAAKLELLNSNKLLIFQAATISLGVVLSGIVLLAAALYLRNKCQVSGNPVDPTSPKRAPGPEPVLVRTNSDRVAHVV